MAYQKCPVCNGTGVVYDNYAMNTSATCPTCEGSRIISEKTGKPPYSVRSVTTTSTEEIIIPDSLKEHNKNS